MDMTMFEWPTKAKVESTDYVAICDADGNEKKIAVDDLKNIQKAETTGETVEEWLKTKLKSYAGFSDGFYPDLGGWSGGTDAFGLITKKGTTVQYVGFMADGKIRMGSYNTQKEAYKIYMHSDEMANHPVGSIWITETETADPNQIFGGTWERYAKGRTLIGVDENDTTKKWNKSGIKAGVAENNIDHKHYETNGADEGRMYQIFGDKGGPYGSTVQANMTAASWAAQTSAGNIRVNKVSAMTDRAQVIDNLPPYITVYIWKRTA